MAPLTSKEKTARYRQRIRSCSKSWLCVCRMLLCSTVKWNSNEKANIVCL